VEVERVIADRGYDHDKEPRQLRSRRIKPEIAHRGTGHSGLGRHRWVVERTFAWLHQFKAAARPRRCGSARP